MTEHVVLVDEEDNDIGSMEKLEAHRAPGQLHRAISVFLFDSTGRLLLQRRSHQKHHFQRLWGNTACSHPRPGEETERERRDQRAPGGERDPDDAARAQQLVLLGGVTGRDAPGYHDWHNALSRLGLLAYDHTFAKAAHLLGSLLIILALIWGGYQLVRQYQNRETFV